METELASEIVADPMNDEMAGCTRSRAPWRRILTAALLVGFLTVAGALGYTLYQQSTLHRLQREAVDTTRDYLAAIERLGLTS